MTFGDDWRWGAPKEEAKKIYDAFRDAGGNFVDTANFYTGFAKRINSIAAFVRYPRRPWLTTAVAQLLGNPSVPSEHLRRLRESSHE